MTKQFAPEFNRTKEGWIIFPDDVKWRKELFSPIVMKHLAKMQMYLEWELIKYVSNPGDTILDPMAGTGTVMVAATMGRRVICIDIEEGYYKIQQEVLERLKQHFELGNVILLHGNSKVMLPIPCNHIIFSPPYAGAFSTNTSSKFTSDKYGTTDKEWQDYARTQGNVGLLNTFLYNQHMDRVYKLCYQSLPTGGTMSVVTKDIIEGGQRIYLTKWIEKVCTVHGFVLQDWFKHQMMGGPYQDIRRAKGEETVDDEDIMIYRRIK